MRRRGPARTAVLVLFGLTLGLAGGATYGSFWSITSNGANTLATAPDWTPPSASGSVIAPSGFTTGGTIGQGSTYYVYANVTDSGNPAAGVASVTADVSSITTGQTAAALTTTGGPWIVDSTSYAYRSAGITADNPLSAGTKPYSLTMADAASPANSATQTGFSVTVSNGPAGADIQTANRAGGTAGKAETGDQVTYTYTTAMAPGSILAGWNGASTTVTAVFSQNGCGTGNDSVLVQGTSLGQVCLGANYVNGSRTFATSTIVMSGNSVVLTLGSGNPQPQTLTVTTATTMAWTPSASATDTFGNACSTATATESGPADVEF